MSTVISKPVSLSAEQELTTIYRELLNTAGEDIHREGLVQTPLRAAKAYLDLTQGYTQNLTELINGALFPSDYDDVVIVKNIEFYSLCEHHLLPFFGRCAVAYLPNQKIIGLSKIPRIVNMFARRLQTQETLSAQIANTIHEVTGSQGVLVKMQAQHLCTMMRGVESQGALTTTFFSTGCFKSDPKKRAEILDQL